MLQIRKQPPHHLMRLKLQSSARRIREESHALGAAMLKRKKKGEARVVRLELQRKKGEERKTKAHAPNAAELKARENKEKSSCANEAAAEQQPQWNTHRA